MDPFTAMMLLKAGISAVPALGKLGAGIWQSIKGNRIEKQNPYPDWLEKTVPDSILKATGLMEKLAGAEDLPGGDLYRNQLSKSTAQGLEAARDMGPGAATSTIPGLVQSEQDALANLGMKFADYKVGATKDLATQLGLQGQYESAAEQFNNMLVLDKYKSAMASASAMKGAGIQNLFGGLSDLAGVGAYSYGNLKTKNMVDSGELSPGAMNWGMNQGYGMGYMYGVPSWNKDDFSAWLNSINQVTPEENLQNEGHGYYSMGTNSMKRINE